MWIPNKHFIGISRVTLFVCCLPGFYLLYGLANIDSNPNIFAFLSHISGHSALTLLCVSFAITPLRRWLTAVFRLTTIPWGKRLADWNFLIRLRRGIGNMAFFYVCIHIATYLYLELGWDWQELYYEVVQRKFLLPGVISALLMSMLAITSFDIFRRKMGRYWMRLHKMTYPLCVFAPLHYLWSVKDTEQLPWVYIGVIALLFLHRIVVRFAPFYRQDDDGMEARRNGKKKGT